MLKALLLGGALLLTAYAQDAPAPAASQEAPAPNPPVKIIRVSRGVALERLKSKVKVNIPEEARKKHIHGNVKIRIRVDRQGNVTDAKLESGPAELADAAIAAVKQWKYEPMVLNGEIVEMESEVFMIFIK